MAMAGNTPRMVAAPGSIWNVPISAPQPKSTFHLIFLKGQPKALGISQILLAYLQVAFGIVLVFTDYANFDSISVGTAITFWAAVAYIFSGSLAIAAENTESRCLVGSSLALNIISAVISAVEIVILLVDVVINGYYSCSDTCATVWAVRETVFISLIIATMIQLCVSISISSFGCSSMIGSSTPQQQVIVIGNSGLDRNVHPTAPNQGMPTSLPMNPGPQYTIFPGSYQN
ncbi:membrane-spanning 4-domains subfamily A member 4D-like [Mantella aurantiaca]